MKPLAIDRYVLETLMPDLVGHDHRPSAILVYLALWTRSSGTRHRAVAASHRELAEATGLSKRAVQQAIGKLERRRLIAITRTSATAIPEYQVLRPWIRRSPAR